MISRGHRKRKISLTRNKLTHKCLHLLFNTDSSLFLRSYLKNLSRHLCGFYQAFGYHTFCRFECFRYLLTKKRPVKSRHCVTLKNKWHLLSSILLAVVSFLLSLINIDLYLGEKAGLFYLVTVTIYFLVPHT